MKTKIITYQAANGQSINLTPQQVASLSAAGQWPKNQRGEEYAVVSHGLHWGTPDCETDLVSDLMAL